MQFLSVTLPVIEIKPHLFNRVVKNLGRPRPLSNITRCQVPSRVIAWFRDSAGDIDFYKISLSQSESFILHQSILLLFICSFFYENKIKSINLIFVSKFYFHIVIF